MGVFTEPWERQGWLTQVLIQQHGVVCGLMYIAGFFWFLLLSLDLVFNFFYRMGVFTEPWERQGWLTQVLIQQHGVVCGLMYIAGFFWFLLLSLDLVFNFLYRMGVFTEPWERQGWLTQVLIQQHGVVCGLMYIAGFFWFLLLPHEQIQSRSYFSENSLLPGLVKGAFVEDSAAKHYLASIADEMDARPNGLPRSWLLAQMRQLGLDTYTHNFTLHYPLADKVKYQGENVYGILRAPRGASTEALVLSTPFRPLSRGNPTTGPSVALMLAFAKFCRNQKYWAKDIIFLITEHEQLGMQAWLEAYHQATSGKKGVLDAGDMSGRAGAIQAAINLELHSDRISHIDVKMEGLNGQLPNLDLVNLVHVLCTKEGVHHTVHGRSSPSDNLSNQFKAWKYSLQTLLMMVTTQATGVPNGNHGLFHRFGIEAVTMEGFKKTDRGSPATYYQLGRVLEGVMRSLNNLLERFHQSYFFYLLSATDHYISIGLYMPSVGLMVSTLLIRALAIWLNMPYCKVKVKQDAEDQSSIAEAAGLFLAVHVGGVAVLSAPQYFAYYGREWMQWPTETALCAGFGVIAFVTIFVPVLGHRGKAVNTAFLNIIALLELATLLLAVAMHNFSLAFFCSLCYVPFALLASVQRFRFLRILGWTLLQPLVLLVMTVTVYTAFMFPDGMILAKAFNALEQALVFSVVDYLIYGNWVFSVAVAFLLPTWVLFWTVILRNKARCSS